ncbi:Amidase [Penicillium waksmanii]|uniref:Amidase n=1 Tax=Penicillium waksmanii TaxID=69791 RepID=UPI002547321F|nr:Amidase [Penicillium waksmanii]KAJ5974609.1 Amidase [Penicillium waksmanii]
MAVENWKALVQKKQAEVSAQIPSSWRLAAEYTDISETASNNVIDIPRRCGILTPKQLDITENHDATSLLEKIHQQQLSAYEVTEAFCIRAAIAQQVTRCLTEMFFDQALERAKELDEHLRQTGQPVGPLHGLPISFKARIRCVCSTIGFTSFIKNGPVESNSPAVEIIVRLGGIPYVKTNIPQTMMAADSHNYVFGRALNPHRSNLNAGGSSGGEGALIAMRGSVLGIGTDIAGSIRIPAICNGTFALRPSADRIPYGGQTSSSRKGLLGIRACAGPLATSVRDLELLMKSMTNYDPWNFDSTAIFSPWREKTRISLFTPPVLRTLKEASEKLSLAGHEIIPLQTPSIKDACALAFRMFAMDPSGTAFQHIAASGEPTIPALKSTSLPHEYMQYEYAPLSLEGLYDLNQQRNQLKEEFREIMVKSKVDAIIMPGYQGTAQPHDVFGFVPYTVLWNVLDYPAAIVPHGKANKLDDASFARDVEYKPRYESDAVEGAPCCIQVVGRHMHEEELIKATEIVATVLAEPSI